MKQRLAILLCLTLILSLGGCASPAPRQPGTFYYFRQEPSYQGRDGVIAPEVRELSGIREDLDALLALYCQGPLTRELNNPLPKDCAAPRCDLTDGVLSLQFGADFAVLGGIELSIAAGCLARTFLPLTGADTLVLTADGSLLNGETAMTLTLEELGLQDNSLDLLHGVYTVYFTDSERRYLIGHSLSLNLTSREELPQLLLERMLTGPSGSGLRSILPVGTRIRSVRVENGLCSVDLSGHFETRRFYSHTGQLLSLMGIVNTLTALDGIDQVEFSVEGDLLSHYGSLTISGPLRSDSRFLGPVRTALNERDITLYVVQNGGPELIPLPARLRQTGAVSQAELVIQALLSDPGTNGFGTSIPSGTTLNSIGIDRGICIVDLSAQYLNDPQSLPTAGRVIAASLCALDGIHGVSITVNGSVPEDMDSAWFGILTPTDGWFL